MWPECCSEEKPERSAAVRIVSDMVRELMRKICDVDWIEKQQELMLKLFKFLWSITSLEDAAQKLTSLAISADKKESEEEKSEEESTGLEDLYTE